MDLRTVLRLRRGERGPLEAFLVDLLVGRIPALDSLDVLLDFVQLLEDDVLAFPVLHHAQRLQRADDVVRVDGHLLTDI